MIRSLSALYMTVLLAACVSLSSVPSLDQAAQSGFFFTITDADGYDCQEGTVRLVVWTKATFDCPGWRLTGSLDASGSNIDVEINGMRRIFRECTSDSDRVPAVYRECVRLSEGKYRLTLHSGKQRTERFVVTVINTGTTARINFEHEREHQQPYTFTPEPRTATVERRLP